jgi:hypothetical protein
MSNISSERKDARADWVSFLKSNEREEMEDLRTEAKNLDARRQWITSRLGILRQRCAKRREVAEKRKQ